MSNQDQISITGVTHAYKTEAGPLPVLDNLNVQIKKGTFTAVVGKSGCGKSKMNSIVEGMMLPDTGEVRLDGELVK